MSDLYLAYKDFNSVVTGGSKSTKKTLDSKDFIARLNAKLKSKKSEPIILIDAGYDHDDDDHDEYYSMGDNSDSLPEYILDYTEGGDYHNSDSDNDDSHDYHNSDSDNHNGDDISVFVSQDSITQFID